jgi:transposase-like protein
MMPQSKIQYQVGLSLTQFTEQYGTKPQCEAALEKARWPEGFRCPRCGGAHYGVIHDRRRKRYQCKNCRHQTTLTAGTVFEATKLALTIWFQAIYVISQAKTGLSALALKRQLEVSYPTSWMIHHKLMHAMQQLDDNYLLGGVVQIDNAYLGGELSGGEAGRFTTRAISSWAQNHVAARTTIITDGLACFAGVAEAGCKHVAKIAGGRKPKELPLF